MSLDINTPRGQVALRDELMAAAIFAQNAPNYEYIHTNKDGSAAVDGIILLNRELSSIVETKCRYDMDFDKFKGEYNSKWLITKSKLDKAQIIAEGLQTKLAGFLFLVPCQTLLSKLLWSPQRGWHVDMDVRKTRTRATINGGVAMRDNYFVDMTNAVIMKEIT